MQPEIHAHDEQSKRNVEKVLALYDEMINQHRPVEAVQKYLRPDYIQHNPLIATGNEALGGWFAQAQAAFPRLRVVVHNVIAVDDYVWAHVNFINLTTNDPDDRGLNGVDIFRFDAEGKLAEHWDAVTPVGDPSEAANSNGIFGRRLEEGEVR